MLTWLRDNAKIFLIATIVIFVALIFLRWGMGQGGGEPRNPYQRPVAMVNGMEILPQEYQEALQSWNQNYRSMLEQRGNPDPESMLLLMQEDIAEEAFQGMIDQRLQEEYLNDHQWKDFTIEQAEALLEAQISMQDLGDMTAEEYLDRIKDEQPGLYQQYLYQTYVNGSSMRFSLATGMISMASMEEVDFILLQNQAQITARYIEIDSVPPLPDTEQLSAFYDENSELFIRAPGSLLRYITFQVLPNEEDMETARNRVDSLSYASSPSQIMATRSQVFSAFGDSLSLEEGERTAPFLGMYSENPTISSYHILLVDSLTAGPDSVLADSQYVSDDTLYIRRWEVPILPRQTTVRRMQWDLEAGMDTMLAEPVPSVPDSLVVVDFGEMFVDGDTPASDQISDEMVTFASETLWTDSLGPVFFSPSFRGGYPAFTIARRLDHYPADTLEYREALSSGMLEEIAIYRLRRDAAAEKAERMLEDITSTGVDLATYASLDSLDVVTTAPFTAAQIKSNARTDPEAEGGLLYCEEFAVAALTEPEFQVTGPYMTGTGCVLAEIISRQIPMDNPDIQTMTYITAQRMHETGSSERIVNYLRETGDIQDLRQEWSQYLESVEDSLQAEQEALEE
ncbi:MAG: hypothetical protein GF388_02405 [Candidatus Aegiribacteria sp.]|nr:hypothetical protein [Candidatus Aegiribacteria sp.]MBD3294168.1 hypothetical protein [Candidatus Fermentibacteria bacterium]